MSGYGTGGAPRPKSLKSNLLWNACGSLVFLGCQWLVTVFVARLSSGYSAAGSLAVAMAVSNIFVPIALYKIRSFQVSDIQNEYSSSDYVAFRLFTISVGLLVSTVYAAFTCSPSDLIITVAYMLFRVSEVFTDVLHGIDQKNERMDYCGKSMLSRGILFLVAFIVSMELTDNLLFSIVCMCISNYPFILIDMRWASRFDDIRPKWRTRQMVSLAKMCLPAVAGMVCCSATTSIVRQYYGLIAGNELLGVYASVCAPAVIVQAGASYVYAPLLSSFADSYHFGRRNHFYSLLLRSLAAIGILTIGSLAFAEFFGALFLEVVFGNAMAAYSDVLLVAFFATAATACIALFSDLTIVVRDMKGNLVGNNLSLLASIVIMVPLVASFDMNGVSLTICVAYSVGCVYMAYSMSSKANLDQNTKHSAG
ncbi:hypothetical protein [Collinsella sp. An307]|uniref:lipopolysaccharide biosynthesis protein n=1 Tax=Collinsella sp. An307 TaxID=1965630 RepID=UPI00117ED71F|nr:hypothetical protein [Collinsella sp. An307]